MAESAQNGGGISKKNENVESAVNQPQTQTSESNKQNPSRRELLLAWKAERDAKKAASAKATASSAKPTPRKDPFAIVPSAIHSKCKDHSVTSVPCHAPTTTLLHQQHAAQASKVLYAHTPSKSQPSVPQTAPRPVTTQKRTSIATDVRPMPSLMTPQAKAKKIAAKQSSAVGASSSAAPMPHIAPFKLDLDPSVPTEKSSTGSQEPTAVERAEEAKVEKEISAASREVPAPVETPNPTLTEKQMQVFRTNPIWNGMVDGLAIKLLEMALLRKSIWIVKNKCPREGEDVDTLMEKYVSGRKAFDEMEPSFQKMMSLISQQKRPANASAQKPFKTSFYYLYRALFEEYHGQIPEATACFEKAEESGVEPRSRVIASFKHFCARIRELTQQQMGVRPSLAVGVRKMQLAEGIDASHSSSVDGTSAVQDAKALVDLLEEDPFEDLEEEEEDDDDHHEHQMLDDQIQMENDENGMENDIMAEDDGNQMEDQSHPNDLVSNHDDDDVNGDFPHDMNQHDIDHIESSEVDTLDEEPQTDSFHSAQGPPEMLNDLMEDDSRMDITFQERKDSDIAGDLEFDEEIEISESGMSIVADNTKNTSSDDSSELYESSMSPPRQVCDFQATPSKRCSTAQIRTPLGKPRRVLLFSEEDDAECGGGGGGGKGDQHDHKQQQAAEIASFSVVYETAKPSKKSRELVEGDKAVTPMRRSNRLATPLRKGQSHHASDLLPESDWSYQPNEELFASGKMESIVAPKVKATPSKKRHSHLVPLSVASERLAKINATPSKTPSRMGPPIRVPVAFNDEDDEDTYSAPHSLSTASATSSTQPPPPCEDVDSIANDLKTLEVALADTNEAPPFPLSQDEVTDPVVAKTPAKRATKRSAAASTAKSSKKASTRKSVLPAPSTDEEPKAAESSEKKPQQSTEEAEDSSLYQTMRKAAYSRSYGSGYVVTPSKRNDVPDEVSNDMATDSTPARRSRRLANKRI
jgi:hypothetical protein